MMVQDGRVQTDAFMATAAQVIPTLAIALAIEVSTTFRYVLAKQPPKDFDTARSGLITLAVGIGITQAAGEVSALSLLLFHYPGWTVWIPIGITTFAVLHAIAGMVLVPVSQLRTTSKPTRLRRRERRAR